VSAPRVQSVEPLKGRRLLVTFVNRVQKVYDCNRIMHLDRFQLLTNEAFFKTVTVDAGGYGISWNDEMDLSEYELWDNGMEMEPGGVRSLSKAANSEVAGSNPITLTPPNIEKEAASVLGTRIDGTL